MPYPCHFLDGLCRLPALPGKLLATPQTPIPAGLFHSPRATLALRTWGNFSASTDNSFARPSPNKNFKSFRSGVSNHNSETLGLYVDSENE